MTVAEAADHEERGRARRYDVVVGVGRCGGGSGRARSDRRVPGGASGDRGRGGAGVSVVPDTVERAAGLGADPAPGCGRASEVAAGVAQTAVALPGAELRA